jgi:two-component system sensor histidine kinase AgrC
MRANFKLYFIAEILMVLITYVLSKFVRIIVLKIINKLNNIEVKFEIPKPVNILFIISIIITITIFSTYVTLSRETLQTGNGYLFSFYAFYLLLFFIFAVAVIYYGFSMLINDHKSKEYLQLKDYTNMIENMYLDLRSFKHDYLNILSTLETYIEKQDINGLKNYYYKDLLLESNIIMNKDISLSLLSHIKINPLKALLSSKIINAHSQGIDVKIELIDDIEEINMSILDICRIIGVFMDNAIEGSSLCDYKFIHFMAIKTENEVIFNIHNSCLSSTPPVYELFKKNFSTKGNGRGIGLKNVRNLIDKRYKNVLFNTKIENCIFKQELIIQTK